MKKNILIITQKVDKNDSVLGFFHDWIIEFAKHVPKLTVICLEKGEYDLPLNVQVFSLGKEHGKSRLKYIIRFYFLMWTLRKKYDSVFVHMNQEYVLLGGIFWRIFGKKVLMWRNHPYGNFVTRMAVFLSNVVYCTSEKSFTMQFKKTKKMPVGVAVSPVLKQKNIKYMVSCFGRISPVKNIETIAGAFDILVALNESSPLTLAIIGDPTPKEEDIVYYKKLISKYQANNNIKFLPGVSHEQVQSVYESYDLLINATSPGSFDKTIIEAMGFGVPVMVCQDIWKNTDFEYLRDYLFYNVGSKEELLLKIDSFYKLSDAEKFKLQQDVFLFSSKYHSLHSLVTKVVQDI